MFLDCISKAIFMFMIYNTVVLLLFGVPKSLSMTYYLFKDRQNILKVLFPCMMTLLGSFLMPCWIQLSEGSNFQFLSFLSAASLLFVAFAPAFKESDLENMVHQISAYCCAALDHLSNTLLVRYINCIRCNCSHCNRYKNYQIKLYLLA